jgi:hypothetical protein
MTTENASAPAAEGQALPVDTSIAEGQQTNVTDTQNPEGQPEPQPRTFTEQEVNEKVQRRIARESRKFQAEAAALRQENEALKAPKPAETKPESAPKREDFNSYEDYVDARADWRADQKVAARMEEFEGKTKKQNDDAARARAGREFEARVDGVIDTGRKNFADFDHVINEAVEDGHLPRRGPLYEAIVDSEVGDKLAYHLAKNPAEAERIQGLSVYAQLRELGKLEDRLSAKKEPRQTMEPIGGARTSNGNGLRDDMSMDDFVKSRNKQIKEREGS